MLQPPSQSYPRAKCSRCRPRLHRDRHRGAGIARHDEVCQGYLLGSPTLNWRQLYSREAKLQGGELASLEAAHQGVGEAHRAG